MNKAVFLLALFALFAITSAKPQAEAGASSSVNVVDADGQVNVVNGEEQVNVVDGAQQGAEPRDGGSK